MSATNGGFVNSDRFRVRQKFIQGFEAGPTIAREGHRHEQSNFDFIKKLTRNNQILKWGVKFVQLIYRVKISYTIISLVLSCRSPVSDISVGSEVLRALLIYIYIFFFVRHDLSLGCSKREAFGCFSCLSRVLRCQCSSGTQIDRIASLSPIIMWWALASLMAVSPVLYLRTLAGSIAICRDI